jgi:hypothetical protein
MATSAEASSASLMAAERGITRVLKCKRRHGTPRGGGEEGGEGRICSNNDSLGVRAAPTSRGVDD